MGNHPFNSVFNKNNNSIVVPNNAHKAATYQLLIVKENSDGSYSLYGNGTSEVSFVSTEYPYLYRVNLKNTTDNNIFEFPITPQAINITTPYSIENLATSNGTVEEHAGIYFKHIVLVGTFGVNPGRKSFGQTSNKVQSNESLFSRTLNSLFNAKVGPVNLISKAVSFLKDKTKSGLTNPNTSQNTPKINPELSNTGYYYALMLENFLEQYAIKKSESYENKKMKLALFLPKLGYALLVTPIQYTFSQNAESPLEYKFNLELKAYKRVKINAREINPISKKITAEQLSNIQKIYQALNKHRQTLSLAYDTIRSVSTDTSNIFEIFRQSILIVKSVALLPFSVADISVDLKNSLNFIKDFESAQLLNVLQTFYSNKFVKGLSEGQTTSQILMKNAAFNQDMDNFGGEQESVDSDIESPYQIIPLLDAINLDDYIPTEEELISFEQDLNNLNNITSDTVQNWIEILRNTAFLIANYFGAGDETVSKIYNFPDPIERLQQLSIEEYEILNAFYDSITVLNLLKNSDFIANNTNRAYEIIGEAVSETNYTFQSSSQNLAIKVPVLYGLTIEQIAQKYLGDYNRWVEIATLNNLNSPYIDEEGFYLPFLANGEGRRFNLPSANNLYVGQKIWLMSDTVPKEQRTIIAIDKLSDSDYLITVDGLDNLSIFKKNDNAKIHAFLPHTTNSTQTIWIPTNQVLENDLAVFSPAKVAELDKYTGISKVDWALSDSNDIEIDSFGDIKLSYGLKNLYQSLKLKIISPEGSRLIDQQYGLGIVPGINNSEISLEELVKKFNAMIEADERFSGIENLEIDLRGPELKINAIVNLRSGLGSVPISVALNKP